MASCSVVGPGRAGRSFAAALAEAGWSVEVVGRTSDPSTAAERSDMVLVTTPDRAVADVAGSIAPGRAVVAHVSGSLGLDVLDPHARRASIHPLMTLPDPAIGSARLHGGGWFAVAGDPIAKRVVEDLGGRWFEVKEDDRAAYHAAACIASNHVVALMGQVERIADQIGVPLDAYIDMARGALDDVGALGPKVALTGPAARGDDATIERHLAALDASERATYAAMVSEARKLAGWTS